MPGEGENHEMGASRISLKVTTAETDGAFFSQRRWLSLAFRARRSTSILS
jgi:hypothetical protein